MQATRAKRASGQPNLLSMKKPLACSALVSLLLFACSARTVPQIGGKINIVASFYPLYEIAKTVGGDLVRVTNLVPAGAEPHDYEPTPQDIIALNEAQLVLYNGAGLEPWAGKIIPELEKSGIQILKLTESESAGATDPHIWLDPQKYAAEVTAVAQKIVSLDPSHASTYEENASRFVKEINDLGALYKNVLQNCTYRSFVTNHAAFGYFSKKYNLTVIPIAGISPDAEPSPKGLAKLTEIIKKVGIKYILVETLVSPKIAEVLASETGAKTLVFNPLEGLTDDEIAQGKNYISVMKENLNNLRTALKCK